MKVLHIFYMSLPDCSGGSIRSRGVVSSQKLAGLDPKVVTSPFQCPSQIGAVSEFYEGVEYIRTYNGNKSQQVSEHGGGLMNKLEKFYQILSFSKRVLKISQDFNANIVHSHSTFFCGLAGLYVSKKMSIPCVYEVRSLWEERAVERGGVLAKIFAVAIRQLETFVMKKSSAVVVINIELRKNILARGIPSEKIITIPNAVEQKNIDLGGLQSWPVHVQSEFVFAYIGSVSPIEGLSTLLSAWNIFCKDKYKVKLIIYGGGIALNELKQQVALEKIPCVEFYGRFNPDDIDKIYSQVDVVVNPRKKSKLTDSVTPLKPLEAMAYNKLVLTSNVGGMQELVTHQINGLHFEADSVESLVGKLNFIYKSDVNDLKDIVIRARNHIVKNKSWSNNALLYKNKYIELIDASLLNN